MKAARVLALLAFAFTMFAADPAIGTWKLNVAKSKYTPGPAPASATITYEETAGGIKRTGESVDADGKKTSFEYTAKYDGKEYPVSGSDEFDAIAVRRINERAARATMKKSGKVVVTARRAVASDGKTMTLTLTGTSAKGEKMKNIAFYDKQ